MYLNFIKHEMIIYIMYICDESVNLIGTSFRISTYFFWPSLEISQIMDRVEAVYCNVDNMNCDIYQITLLLLIGVTKTLAFKHKWNILCSSITFENYFNF